MILGHGILGDHRLLAPQIEALARQYRLVLIGATAGAEQRWRRLKYETVLALYGWAGAGVWVRGRVSELALSPQFRARSGEEVERWVDCAAELPHGIVRRSVRAILKRPHSWDRLGEIGAPAW